MLELDAQTSLISNYRDLSTSTSQVLRLNVFSTTAWHVVIFLFSYFFQILHFVFQNSRFLFSIPNPVPTPFPPTSPSSLLHTHWLLRVYKTSHGESTQCVAIFFVIFFSIIVFIALYILLFFPLIFSSTLLHFPVIPHAPHLRGDLVFFSFPFRSMFVCLRDIFVVQILWDCGLQAGFSLLHV